MSKIHDFFGRDVLSYAIECKYLVKLLRFSIILILQKMKENNISQLGDYVAAFGEQQYTHGSCYISLFKFKSFDQLIPPKLPQILDIYSVVAL